MKPTLAGCIDTTPRQVPIKLYLVDLFGSQAAASALGANNLLRFVLSTFLPLAGPPMYYKALGYPQGQGHVCSGCITRKNAQVLWIHGEASLLRIIILGLTETP